MRRWWTRRAIAAGFCASLGCSTALAADQAAPSSAPLVEPAGTAARARIDSAPSRQGCQRWCYVHTHLDLGVGRGLRFNNPFRLQHQLGGDARSVSATATSLDARLGALVGDPLGWHYGVGVGVAASVQGVPQQVITPALELAYPLSSHFWARGHLGPGIVTQPDANVGLEAGLQLVGLIRAGIGAFVALGYAHYWGAETDESSATSIPILFGQAGLTLRYEVLP